MEKGVDSDSKVLQAEADVHVAESKFRMARKPMAPLFRQAMLESSLELAEKSARLDTTEKLLSVITAASKNYENAETLAVERKGLLNRQNRTVKAIESLEEELLEIESELQSLKLDDNPPENDH